MPCIILSLFFRIYNIYFKLNVHMLSAFVLYSSRVKDTPLYIMEFIVDTSISALLSTGRKNVQ